MKNVIPVENVLVAPSTSDDIVDSTNLYGKRAIYTIAIPKGAHSKRWMDTEEYKDEAKKRIVFSEKRIKYVHC